jgi:hypothetical protein
MRLNRRAVAALAGAAAALAAAAAIAFQDSIARFGINPRTPFQTAPPPPPPEYGARGAWALWPDKEHAAPAAEIFYVHSTTYASPRSWNAPIAEDNAEAALRRDAIPNEAGPFAELGPIFAPRYRQATLFSFFTHKYDGVAARQFAYGDVRGAFLKYLDTAQEDIPLVLVGYGQGGFHVQRLLEEFFRNDKALRGRLAVAYVLDQATPLDLFETALGATPPCAAAQDIRCVVSYIDYEAAFRSEMERARRRSMTWTPDGRLEATDGRDLLCVNPLSWRIDEIRMAADAHVGAASATGLKFGERPPALARSVGAACVNGILAVDRPDQSFLRRRAWFGEKWRTRSYNLFFFDLAADALRRADLAGRLMEEEARTLEPIGESVDLEESPINKAPGR